ncbi:unnamed protein product, partial [Staurois parvus]
MGPVLPPHAAARSRVCHGSLYGLPIAAVSIATLCHVATFRSPHTAGGFHFCHRVLYGLPLLLPPPPHCGSTLWFWPVTAQMSEVCGDSKIDGTHLHVILTDSIISLPQQTPRAFKFKGTVFCTNI